MGTTEWYALEEHTPNDPKGWIPWIIVAVMVLLLNCC